MSGQARTDPLTIHKPITISGVNTDPETWDVVDTYVGDQDMCAVLLEHIKLARKLKPTSPSKKWAVGAAKGPESVESSSPTRNTMPCSFLSDSELEDRALGEQYELLPDLPAEAQSAYEVVLGRVARQITVQLKQWELEYVVKVDGILDEKTSMPYASADEDRVCNDTMVHLLGHYAGQALAQHTETAQVTQIEPLDMAHYSSSSSSAPSMRSAGNTFLVRTG